MSHTNASHTDALRPTDVDEFDANSHLADVRVAGASPTSMSETPATASTDHASTVVEVAEIAPDDMDADTDLLDEEELPAPVPTLKVLLYSDDRTTRQQVHLALGRRIAADLPEVEIFDTATQPAVFKALETHHYDVVILDGEAQPAGGFGIAHQVKDEISNCPPVVLLVARRDDAWMATWSRAEGVSSYPVDPIRLPHTVAEVVRGTRNLTAADTAATETATA